MEGEKYKIDGLGNIIIDGNINSTITIGTGKPDTPTITIIVLASVSSFVHTVNEGEAEMDLKPLLAHHGDKARDWKPFGSDKTIEDVLMNFHQETGFNLEVFFMNELDLSPEARRSLQAGGRTEIIFIIDPLALMNKNNTVLSTAINDVAVGGGIIPLYEGMDVELKQYLTAIYEEKLDNWVHNKFTELKKACLNFHLNVPEEKIFYRSISNLAFIHLGLEFEPNSNQAAWITRYLSTGLNGQSSKLSIQ